MEYVIRVVNYLYSFYLSGGTLLKWFVTPMFDFDFYTFQWTFSPIEIVSISGLIAFLTFAVVKWLVT